VNAFFGFLTAWVLVRYRFPGRRILDAIVDLPFALPTAVSGIALTAVFAPGGALGRFMAGIGWPVAYTPTGVTVAMVFIGLPFVVRTLQPAFEELASELGDAASSLGASPGQVMTRVVLPLTLPALITGFSLALARGIGEYGSIVFISGNLPFKTEITSLLIITKLEEFDYTGAAVIAMVMMTASFVLLFAINLLQKHSLKWLARKEA
jgi:sulfate transport system permease protein